MRIYSPICPMESIHAVSKASFTHFVYAGPMLDVDVPVSVGENVVSDQFVFADLNLATVDATPLSQ